MPEERADIELLITVARMYYEGKLSQEEIGAKVNVSRPTVSRMLKRAERKGYVRKVVIDPFDGIQNMRSELIESFALKDAVIVQSMSEDHRQTKKLIGKAGAEYLLTVLKPNDIIGVTWGTTMYEVAKALPQTEFEGLTVVQLSGFIYDSTSNDYIFEAVHSFGSKLHSKVHYLYTPAITPSVKIKEAFFEDENVRHILQLGRRCNIALYGLGIPERSSMILQNGYLKQSEFDSLHLAGVAGDIFYRFFDDDGRIVSQSLNERTIGSRLEDLREKEYAICVVTGKNRARGILGALRARYMNVLITDEATAKEVLGLWKKGL